MRFTVTLVDRRRSTPSASHRPALPCRVLPTVVRYPAGATGPVPLVVVAHGRDNDPSSLATLLDAWAGAGYVVAAPTFPVTRKDRSGAPVRAESVAQAADLRFVVDRVLAASRGTAPSPLRGLVDPAHVGAAGMSLGGLAVYGLVSNTCCRDRRVGAAILLAAVRREFPDERYEENRAPVLLVQGDADPGYHNSVEAYPELVPPKWFVTLTGSQHSPPFEVPPGPEAPLVYAMTTAFWDRYLKGDPAATARITSAVQASAGKATLRSDPGRQRSRPASRSQP
jgi:dienelactone hydrolase